MVEPMRRVAKLGIWIGALLLGALVPASLAAALAHTVTVLPVAFVITLGHATILGLPALLIYRAARWTRLSAAIAGGLIIGMIPGGLLFWPVRLSLRSTASVDGIPTLINGTPTAAGWFSPSSRKYGEGMHEARSLSSSRHNLPYDTRIPKASFDCICAG